MAYHTISLSAREDCTKTFALSVTGLPTGTSANFNPDTIAAPSSVWLTIGTTAGTPAGTHDLTVPATAGERTLTKEIRLIIAQEVWNLHLPLVLK